MLKGKVGLVPLNTKTCLASPGLLNCESSAISTRPAHYACLELFLHPDCQACVTMEQCLLKAGVDTITKTQTKVMISHAGVLIRSLNHPVRLYHDGLEGLAGAAGQLIQPTKQGTYWLKHSDFQYFTVGDTLYASQGEDTHETKIITTPLMNFSTELSDKFREEAQRQKLMDDPKGTISMFITDVLQDEDIFLDTVEYKYTSFSTIIAIVVCIILIITFILFCLGKCPCQASNIPLFNKLKLDTLYRYFDFGAFRDWFLNHLATRSSRSNTTNFPDMEVVSDYNPVPGSSAHTKDSPGTITMVPAESVFHAKIPAIDPGLSMDEYTKNRRSGVIEVIPERGGLPTRVFEIYYLHS